MSDLAKLLKNPIDKEKENNDRIKMLALLLANKALTVAAQEGSFQDEDGNLDYSKAIPTVPWVT